jgi:hypothetical protein
MDRHEEGFFQQATKKGEMAAGAAVVRRITREMPFLAAVREVFGTAAEQRLYRSRDAQGLPGQHLRLIRLRLLVFTMTRDLRPVMPEVAGSSPSASLTKKQTGVPSPDGIATDSPCHINAGVQ